MKLSNDQLNFYETGIKSSITINNKEVFVYEEGEGPTVLFVHGWGSTSFKFRLISSELVKEVISQGHEGIVVRNAYAFHNACFQENVMKFVRPNHVQSDENWSSKNIIRNELKEEENGISKSR